LLSTAIFSTFASMSERRLLARGARYISGAVAFVLGCLLTVSALPTDASTESRQQCAALTGEWINELDRDDRALLVRRTRDQCLGAARWMRQQTMDASKQVKRQICQDLVLIWAFKECEYRRDYIDRRAYAPCMTWSREMHRRCLVDDLAWFEAAADGQSTRSQRSSWRQDRSAFATTTLISMLRCGYLSRRFYGIDD
jgi:hypothetical protein